MNPALTIVGNTRIALAFSESSLAAGSLAQSFFSAALASSSTPAAAAASAARGAVRLIVEIATATIATRPRVHFLMSSLLVRSVILPLPSRNLAWPDEAPIVSFLHHVVPALAVRVVHHHRVAPGDLHHRAERLGVV